MLALFGVLGRGIGFDGVQEWGIQTTGNRRDEGEVMKGILKGVWEFCECLFWGEKEIIGDRIVKPVM